MIFPKSKKHYSIFLSIFLAVFCLIGILSAPAAFAAEAGQITLTLDQILLTEDSSPPPSDVFTYCFTPAEAANPMPAGSDSDGYTFTHTGTGQEQIGPITFVEPGIYRYKLRCIAGKESGYDNRVYIIEIFVKTDLTTGMVAYEEQTNAKVSKVIFEHRYAANYSDMALIAGTKTWNYGKAPLDDRPDSITVFIKNGAKIVKELQVTARDGWQWSVSLPAEDESGNPIQYTVDEGNVPHYTHRVNGYDLTNTYVSAAYPGDSPKTGDESNPLVWFLPLIGSCLILIIILILHKKLRAKMYG